jgi:chaperonin GroES
MTTKLVPNDARVIVKPIEEESVRPSGIVIADVSKQKPTRGRVISVGPGGWLASGDVLVRVKPDVVEGQVVVYDKYSGLPYKLADGTELVILRVHDILAVEVDEP